MAPRRKPKPSTGKRSNGTAAKNGPTSRGRDEIISTDPLTFEQIVESLVATLPTEQDETESDA
jgi:hypothetical protein